MKRLRMAALARTALTLAVCLPALFTVIGFLTSLSSNGLVVRPSSSVAWVKVSPDFQGRPTACWFHRGEGGRGVIVAHGLLGNRNDMVPRGEFLAKMGHTVLLPDLYAHGETPGRRKTFGWEEAKDLRNGFAFLKSRGVDTVAVIGVSLGAVAAVFAYGREAPFAGMVLEGPYADIAGAIGNRMRWLFGLAGAVFAPLLTAQVPLLLGLRPSALSVVDRIGSIRCPKLMVAGSEDRRTTLADTRRVYLRAAGPKELWILEGADHVDFHEWAPREYEARIGRFLGEAIP